MSDFEKEQLTKKYMLKKTFAKQKDLDKRFEAIYNEKIEQYWRFSKQEIEHDADDSHVEQSEPDEETPENQDKAKEESDNGKGK